MQKIKSNNKNKWTKKDRFKFQTGSVSILLKMMLIICVNIAFDVAWFIGLLLQVQPTFH